MSAAGYTNFIQLAAYATNYWSTHGNYTSPGDVSFIADIPGAFLPPSILSVTARVLDATTEAITWTTSVETTNNIIDYGTTTNYGSSITADGSTTHSNNLSGLSTGTNYYYQVRSTAISNGLLVTNSGAFVAGYVPTWACVGTNISDSGSATTLSVTFTPATSNLLVAFLHSTLGDASGGLTDANNTWTQITNNVRCGDNSDNHSGGNMRMYYVAGCSGATSTATAANCYSLQVLEFSGGMTGAGALDVSTRAADQKGGTTTTDNCSAEQMTVASTNVLVVAGLACYYGDLSAGTGYKSPGVRHGLVEYRLGQLSGTNVDARISDDSWVRYGTQDNYGMVAVSFKPSN